MLWQLSNVVVVLDMCHEPCAQSATCSLEEPFSCVCEVTSTCKKVPHGSDWHELHGTSLYVVVSRTDSRLNVQISTETQNLQKFSPVKETCSMVVSQSSKGVVTAISTVLMAVTEVKL